jgi:hypothetical protein
MIYSMILGYVTLDTIEFRIAINKSFDNIRYQAGKKLSETQNNEIESETLFERVFRVDF